MSTWKSNNPKTNLKFYENKAARYNPEHVKRAKEAWDAMPAGVRGSLESMDLYRENYYTVFDKSNPDKHKNAPADTPEWQAHAEEINAKNKAMWAEFWPKLHADTPYGGHERLSGDIHTVFGDVEFIDEEQLPDAFKGKMTGAYSHLFKDIDSQYLWEEGYFYARDEEGQPFRQTITTVDPTKRK